MALCIVSTSISFRTHMQRVLDQPFEFQPGLPQTRPVAGDVWLLHLSSPDLACLDWLKQPKNAASLVGICSDNPNISEMLNAVEAGARAYCNSYMQAPNYQQLIRLLQNKQSWFPPPLLAQTFQLAQQAIKGKDTDMLLEVLTQREKQVALAVSEGLSNREISELLTISEPTVKTHLSSIFIKLEVRDRVALVLYIK